MKSVNITYIWMNPENLFLNKLFQQKYGVNGLYFAGFTAASKPTLQLDQIRHDSYTGSRNNDLLTYII
jgi:hypothetical protein